MMWARLAGWPGCLFVVVPGGDTEWKLSHYAARLTWEAYERGKWVHMGRVNRAPPLAPQRECFAVVAYRVAMKSASSSSHGTFSLVAPFCATKAHGWPPVR